MVGLRRLIWCRLACRLLRVLGESCEDRLEIRLLGHLISKSRCYLFCRECATLIRYLGRHTKLLPMQARDEASTLCCLGRSGISAKPERRAAASIMHRRPGKFRREALELAMLPINHL
jgi:hypothetical protein